MTTPVPVPSPAEGTDASLRTAATRSIAWVIVERWSIRLSSLAIFAILARLLSPADFGLMALALSIVAVLQVFVDAGFSKVLVQKQELAPKDASTAFWTSLALALAIYGLAALTAPALASLLDEPGLARVIQVISLSLPISALSATPAALLERTFEFRKLSVRQVIGTLAGAGIAVPMAFSGAGVWALVAQSVATPLVSCIALWSSTSWRPRFEFSLDSLRSLAGMGSSILGVGLLDTLQGNLDKLVIGAVFSSNALGYYFLAQRIGAILTELVTSVMFRVSLTTFSRVQHDLPRLRRIYGQFTFVASSVSIPLFGFLALFADPVVPFAFGDKWQPSVPIIWILATAWALGAVMFFDRTALLATGHAGRAFRTAAVQNGVNVGLLFALLPLGVTGVVLSRLAHVVAWPYRLHVLQRAIGLDVPRYLSQIGRCAAAMVLPLGIVLALKPTAWAQGPSALWSFALPVGAVSLLIYAATLWWLAGADNRQLLRKVLDDVLARVPGARRKRLV